MVPPRLGGGRDPQLQLRAGPGAGVPQLAVVAADFPAGAAGAAGRQHLLPLFHQLSSRELRRPSTLKWSPSPNAAE